MTELASKVDVAHPTASVPVRMGVHRAALGVLGGAALMALAAQCRIPVPGTEVPMTLQSLAMLLAGLALSPVCAVGSMLLYLGLGTAGVPVFVGGSAGLLGPTGGYLAGFAAGAWIVSILANRSSALGRLALAGAAGMAVLFCFGVGWRFVWLGGNWSLAVSTGLLPFLFKALVQVAFAVALVRTVRGRFDSSRS